MYQKVAPMFLVENVDKAVEWYKDIFGAEPQASLPKEPPFEWVSLMLGDMEIMFSQKKSAQKWYSENVIVAEKPANFIAYIYVEDANNLYDRIKDKVKIIMEPVDQWYGIREFAIQDPFGIILIFAQIVE
ncbi:MAG: VOC family protein [candidate division WOR-3 bacterium]